MFCVVNCIINITLIIIPFTRPVLPDQEHNFILFECLDNLQIDILLGIHILDVVGNGNKIDHFKRKTILCKPRKMCPVKPGVFSLLDDVFNDLRNLFQLLSRSLVSDAQREGDSSRFLSFEIMDPGFGEVTV